MNTPPLPPGFQLDAAPQARPQAQPSGAGLPALPPGFALDQPQADNSDLMASLSAKSQFSGGPTARGRYNVALRKVRETQFPDMSDEQWADYSEMKYGTGLNAQRDQGSTLGFSDEISAAMGGLGSQVRQWTGGGGPGYGEGYGDLYELEQARLEMARQENGAAGTATEILSGMGGAGPARAAGGAIAAAPQAATKIGRAAQAVLPSVAGGSVYGFGSTDGDLGERANGALVGGSIAAAGSVVAPVVGNVIQGTARRVAQMPVNVANRAAAKQAVRTAPSAADIKGVSQAAYKASEDTGAIISHQAMQGLTQEMDNLARMNGLMLSTGELAEGAYQKAAFAVRSVRDFARGPVSMKQAQTVLRSLRAAQKSTDPAEARIGNMMVNQFEDFLDGLPPSAFGNGDGSEAVAQWAKGRTEWARHKRTQTIEDIISDARLFKGAGGFANGVRAGFAKILKAKNAKARRGFSAADLQAMEDFVAGGPVKDLLERIGSGAGLPGGVLGGLTGGPIGAVAVPAAGGLARRETNRQARNMVGQLRAQVALPGGIPKRALPPPIPMPPRIGTPSGFGANGAVGDDREWLNRQARMFGG